MVGASKNGKSGSVHMYHPNPTERRWLFGLHVGLQVLLLGEAYVGTTMPETKRILDPSYIMRYLYGAPSAKPPPISHSFRFIDTMLATILLATASVASAASVGYSLDERSQASNPFAWKTGCPTGHDVPYSCHNTTVQSNSCCFESPGGLMMQVQLWDTTGQTGQHDQWVGIYRQP